MRFQQEPQAGESNVTAGAPPMKGKVGKDPKVGKPRVKRPFGPFEHATVFMDPLELSYTVSKVTRS